MSGEPRSPKAIADDSPGAAPPKPSTTTPPSPVVFAFAGDVHYEGGLRELLDRSPESMLAGVSEVLDRADLTVVNLESAIGTTRGRPEPKSFTFRAPPSALGALTNAGVDVISMANNHSMDFGDGGLEETRRSPSAARRSSGSVWTRTGRSPHITPPSVDSASQ